MGRANDICDRLAALPVPSIAVVHGFCLGGGLEIALACKYRIAIEDARFGFPEISALACIRAWAAPRASRISSIRRRRWK